MNLRIRGLAALAAAAIAAIVTVTATGPSAAESRRTGPGATQGSDDVSSAHRTRRHRHYAPRGYVYRAPAYAAPYYYYGGASGDPSLMANGRPYPRPYDPGGCIIDEGYGRFTSCSNR